MHQNLDAVQVNQIIRMCDTPVFIQSCNCCRIDSQSGSYPRRPAVIPAACAKFRAQNSTVCRTERGNGEPYRLLLCLKTENVRISVPTCTVA